MPRIIAIARRSSKVAPPHNPYGSRLIRASLRHPRIMGHVLHISFAESIDSGLSSSKKS